jgi:hypothetical protein
MKLPEKLSLNRSVHSLEDGIITLSGPALAISSVLAVVDLLTGGHILQQYAWFSLAWALCLALTLDFQILALGARSHQIYQADKKKPWRKGIEITLCLIVAAAISLVSIQMQSIIARVNSFPGLSVEAAAHQLGINTIYLIWERSALVLVLIFLSGWFREVKQAVSNETKHETPLTISDEVMQTILSKLAKLDNLEQAITQQKTTIIFEERETPLALPVPSETRALNLTQIKVRPGLNALFKVETVTQSEDESREPLQSDEKTLEGQITALLASQPGLSSRKVAERLKQPPSTVYRVMKQLEQSIG